MSDKHFVGFNLTDFSDNGEQTPVSRVTLLIDEENYLTAGDDSGITLEAKCPHATQAMVNSILATVKGKKYRMFEAENARLDPAAELGDGVTAGRVYSTISRLSDDGNVFPGITAPGQAELEDEYPTNSGGPMTQEFNRKLAQTRSQITKTADEIRLSVKRVEDDVEKFGTDFSVSIEGITSRVSDAEGNISTLQQTAKNIRIAFASEDSSVDISAGRITFNTGTFVLNGGNITIDSEGNLTSENGTIKGASISGSSITTESEKVKTVIEKGLSKYYYDGVFLGQIGTGQIAGTSAKGIVYEVEYNGEYMAWTAKTNPISDSYYLKMLYSNKDIKTGTEYHNYTFAGDKLHIECDVFTRYKYEVGVTHYELGSARSESCGSIHGSITSGLDIESNSYKTWFGIAIVGESFASIFADEIGLNGKVIDYSQSRLVSTSDARAKKNIRESDIDALSVINKIKTYSFDFINSGEHREIGFISQQIKYDSTEDLIYYNENQDRYCVIETSFIPYLVKAVQQLYNMIAPGSTVMKIRAKEWTDPYSEMEKEAYVERQEEIKKQIETFVEPEHVYIENNRRI